MKRVKLIFSVIALCSCTIVSTAQIPNYVPTNGLIGWWPFTGNTNDLSPNSNNGTINGAPVLNPDRYNNSNSAYLFNGTSDYISCNIATLPVGSTPRTLSTWIQTTSGVLPANYDPTIVNVASYGINTVGPVIFGQYVRVTTGKNYFETGSAQNQINSVSTVNDGNWHNLVTTYGGPGTRVRMYVDGVKEDSTAILTLATGTSYFGIGKSPWMNMFYQGKIDDVGLWDRVLTQSEITDLYLGCTTINATCSPNQTVTAGNSAQFTITSSGAISTYQWQTDLGIGFQNLNNSGQYNGVTTAVLNISNNTAANNNQPFRCIVTSGPCTFTSNPSVLTVNSCTMSILSGPASQTISVGNTAQMTISSNDPSATYQWQTDIGVGYQNLSNAVQYSGATTNTLNIANVTLSNNNQPFRCVITSNACTFTSSPAVLTVSGTVTGIYTPSGNNPLLVYPNPTTDNITLTVDATLLGSDYMIFNQLGGLVLKGELKTTKQFIRLSNLPAGVYFGSIRNSGQIFKILKSSE